MDEYFEYFHQLNKQIHNLSKKQYDEIEEFLGDMEQSVPTLKEYLIEVCDAINDGSSLGIYSSEERAKEVLQEIIDKIWESSSLRMDIKGINCEVREQTYYMPER